MSACFSFRSVFFPTVLLISMIFIAGGSAAAQSGKPEARPPRLHVAGAENPVRLTSLEIRTEIKGGFAETSLEMVFHNPNKRILEGELEFPLTPGQEISGLALDINGELRRGSPVAKARGQEMFDEIARRKVDPALLEATGGNAYRLRIYPLPAGGQRRVVIRIMQPLVSENGLLHYRLPLAFADSLESFSIEVEIVSPNGQVRAEAGKLNLSLEQSGTVYRGRVEHKNITPGGWLDISLPAPDSLSISATATRWRDRLYFSAAASITVPDKARDLPDMVTILWDASASGLERGQAKELALLDSYFQSFGSGRARLIALRDKAEAPQIFKVENGDWQDLRTAINALIYDGATNLTDWTPAADCREYLLFSDGLANYRGSSGQDRFPEMRADQRLFAINSAATADYAALRALAVRGQVIDLAHDSLKAAEAKLLREGARVSIKNSASAGAAEAVLGPDSAYLNAAADGSGGLIRLAGWVRPGGGIRNIPILVEFPGGSSEDLAVTLPGWDDCPEAAGDEAPLSARLWGRYAVAELEKNYQANQKAIIRLGRELGIVSRATSLIVLETAADYARYDVDPPASLKAQVEALRQAMPNSEGEDRLSEEHLLALWRDKVKWWENDFERPSKDYSGEKITLNFVNKDVREVIRIIGRASGKSLVVSEAVNDEVALTLGLIDTPWDQALDAVAAAGRFEVRESGGVIVVTAEPESSSFGRQSQAYIGEKITLNVENRDVQNIIRMIGRASGKNIVMSEALKGELSLDLTDVPWDQALDAVASAGGFDASESGGVIVAKSMYGKTFSDRQPRTYTGEKITLDVENGDSRDIIQLLGRASGNNIVISEAVQNKLSLKLTNVPWDQALDAVAAAGGFEAEESGGVIVARTKHRETSLGLQPKAYTGEKITLDYATKNVQDIIHMIGRVSGKNIAVSDVVKDKLTLGLTNVPWDQALDAVAAAGSLSVDEPGGVIMINSKWPETSLGQQPKAYAGEKITLDYANEDVRSIFRLIGQVSGKTVDVSEGVKANISLSLTNMPWDQALDIVAAASHLAIEESDGIIKIYDWPTFNALELYRELASAEWSGSAEPVPGSNQLLTAVFDKEDAPRLWSHLNKAESDGAFRTIYAPRIMAANDQTVTIKQGQQIPYTSGSSANTAANVNFRGGFRIAVSVDQSAGAAPTPPTSPSIKPPERSRPGSQSGGSGSDPALTAPRLATTLKPWSSNAPYLDRIKEAKSDELYAVYLDERPDYMGSSAFFIDVADRFFELGLRELGLRVLSNLAEMQLENRRLLRLLAYRLVREGEMTAALPVLERVRELAPYEPQSLRDIATVKAALGRTQEAVDLLYQVAARKWSSRFGGINAIALTEMNALIAGNGGRVSTEGIDSRLIKNLASDIRIVLSWDTDNTNFDFRVIAPDGEVSSFNWWANKNGGRMSGNCTEGYGPEEFMLKKALPGVYRVEVSYSGDFRQTLERAGESTVTVAVYTNFGRPEQKDELTTTLRMQKTGVSTLAGEFMIEDD